MVYPFRYQNLKLAYYKSNEIQKVRKVFDLLRCKVFLRTVENREMHPIG